MKKLITAVMVLCGLGVSGAYALEEGIAVYGDIKEPASMINMVRDTDEFRRGHFEVVLVDKHSTIMPKWDWQHLMLGYANKGTKVQINYIEGRFHETVAEFNLMEGLEDNVQLHKIEYIPSVHGAMKVENAYQICPKFDLELEIKLCKFIYNRGEFKRIYVDLSVLKR